MISKELLGKVLDLNISEMRVEDSYVLIKSRRERIFRNINIHELDHKCKLWAQKHGYTIVTGIRLDGTTNWDILCAHRDTDVEDEESAVFSRIAESEPEGVFEACQWILNRKD